MTWGLHVTPPSAGAEPEKEAPTPAIFPCPPVTTRGVAAMRFSPGGGDYRDVFLGALGHPGVGAAVPTASTPSQVHDGRVDGDGGGIGYQRPALGAIGRRPRATGPPIQAAAKSVVRQASLHNWAVHRRPIFPLLRSPRCGGAGGGS